MKIIDRAVDLCKLHLDAYHRILDAYPIWSSSYGGLARVDFLKRLVALAETGERVRELVKLMIDNPWRWK